MNPLLSFRQLWPEKTFLPYMFDIACTTIFSYLLFSALMVIDLNGFSSRINLLGFLIPHSTKTGLWSAATILWLRPRFKWRFPFAMFFLYCCSELLTNAIWMGVHLPEGYKFPLTDGMTSVGSLTFPTTEGIFLLSTLFFVLGITLCTLFLRGQVSLKWDWSVLPFVVWVVSWILLGYQTESTIANPSYWLEFQELVWNVLYVTMAVSVFRAKSQVS